MEQREVGGGGEGNEGQTREGKGITPLKNNYSICKAPGRHTAPVKTVETSLSPPPTSLHKI